VVEQGVDLDTAFCAPELGPCEEGQTEGDDGGVQRQEFVFETEACLATAKPAVGLKVLIAAEEQHTEQPGGPFLTDEGQGRTGRRLSQSQVFELAETASHSVANLAQTVSPGHLTEKHGNELRPAGEALGAVFKVILDKSGSHSQFLSRTPPSF
jgi:hypothetical protein